MQRSNVAGSGTLRISTLLFAALTASAVAAAQGASAPPKSTNQVQLARDLYAKGKAAYGKGQFQEALEAFQKAYEAKPHPTVVKSIAESMAQLGDISGAIATFEKYVDDPAAPNKGAIRSRIDELKKLLVPLEVLSSPSGAKIALGGADTGKLTPSSFELSPGRFKVELALDGYEPFSEELTLASGGQGKVNALLQSTKPATPLPIVSTDKTDETEEAEEENKLRPLFWTCVAVAGAGLVSGVVFGSLAVSVEKDYKSEPTQAKKDAGERDTLIADISFGVAAAGAIAGTIVLIVDRKRDKAEEEARVSWTPVATGNTLGINTRVNF